MATPQKISSLERFISQNPALADVPAITIAGRPTTLREALNSLRAGVNVNEIVSGLKILGVDPPPWQLCQDFYRRLTAARSDIKIATLGFVPPISPAEAFAHVQARDEVGTWLVKAYGDLLSFMAVRVDPI